MANGAFKFKDNSGNVVSFISGSGSNISFSGGTLDLSGMTGLTLGGLIMSGSITNALTASSAPSYLLTSSFNTYSSSLATTGSNTFIGNQTISGSIVSTVTTLVSGSSQITYSGLTGIPSGIVSGSSQLTSSYDDRYVLSGSITQTTWDNIASKPSGIASGSSQIDITGTTGYSTFSSSISTSIGSLSGSVAITTSGLSSSIGSLSSSFATTTIGLKNRIDSIETTTGSLNTFTSSASGRLTSLETASGSIRTDFNTYTGSNDSTNTTQNSRLTSIEGITGSISSLNTYTGSNNTIIGTLQTATSSLNSYTSSNTTNINAIHTSTGSFKSFTSSFDTAFGMSGADVTVKGNLTVSGTQTIVNSTTVAIGDNIIQLNGTGATNAGLVVRDATAPNTVSGSFLWDSTNDKWIAGSLGSEDDIVLRTATQTLTNKTINASQLVDASVTNTKLANSSITIAGTSTSLGGTISAATILSGTGTVSGSSQIDLTATTNYASGILTRLNAVGVFSGSAQVTGIGNAQLTNSSFFVGTTSISLGRASASQTLTGVAIDGNAGTVTNGVYTTGDQTIGGTKTFSSTIVGSINGSAAQLDGQGQAYYFSKANMDAARSIVSGTNLDTDLENGGAYSSYGAGGTSWNAPFGYGGVIAYAFTSGIRAQFGFDIRHTASDYGDLWYRTKNNVGYSTWRKMWHDGNLTNLNQLTNGPGYITSDSTKLPLAGGTMTGTIRFSNVVGNKIDFYFLDTDRYGIQVQSSELRIHSGAQGASTGGVTLGKSTDTTFTEYLRVRNDGHVVPGGNGTQNLGSSSLRWATVFTSDLSMSNGIGDYTIVEGEEKLYLYNNKNNKVYSFVLQEEDPATATPKMS